MCTRIQGTIVEGAADLVDVELLSTLLRLFPDDLVIFLAAALCQSDERIDHKSLT